MKATGQNVWVVMRDLEKPNIILSCVSTSAQTEQTNSNIQTPTRARQEAGNWELWWDQLKFNSTQNLPTWKLEENKIYNRANSYFSDLAKNKVLLGQQNRFSFVGFFLFIILKIGTFNTRLDSHCRFTKEKYSILIKALE